MIHANLKCSFGPPTSLRISLHLSWHFSLNSCWFIRRGERCNVLLWLPFHFAWSKWINYEMEAGFWTQVNWPDSKKGPIWEQSPTDISAVQICYRNEYHCCLGGPAPELTWWMTASRKISPPDVRLLQSDWTSVKINMKEMLFNNTNMAAWWPAGFDHWLTFQVCKNYFPCENGKSRTSVRCVFPGHHQGCTWGLSAEGYSWDFNTIL